MCSAHLMWVCHGAAAGQREQRQRRARCSATRNQWWQIWRASATRAAAALAARDSSRAVGQCRVRGCTALDACGRSGRRAFRGFAVRGGPAPLCVHPGARRRAELQLHGSAGGAAAAHNSLGKVPEAAKQRD